MRGAADVHDLGAWHKDLALRDNMQILEFLNIHGGALGSKANW